MTEAVGSFSLIEAAAHHFDQAQAEVVAGLRQERKGFFVSLAGKDVYGFSFIGDVDELAQFLKDVIASVQAELDLVEGALAAGEEPS